MTDDARAVWNKALERYRERLNNTKGRDFKAVDSIDALIEKLNLLRTRHCSPDTAQYLDRLLPVFHCLSSFSVCVKRICRASPTEFVLLWSPISLILDLSCDYVRGLAVFVETLEDIKRTLPRIAAYSSRLLESSYPFLEDALVTYYVELISFFFDAVDFFGGGAFRKILQPNRWLKSFRVKSCKRLERLRILTHDADQAAGFVGGQLTQLNQRRQHQELISLFSGSTTTMLLGNIPYYHLPVRQNPAFTGREVELRKMRELLQPGSVTNKTICACLHGLPGVGKTQLALEFAHTHWSQYGAILWVSAETPLKIQESFDKIAHGLELVPDVMQHPGQGKEAVMRWFKSTSRKPEASSLQWLVIFDNVNDASFLDTYWPSAAKGSVIITCKSPEIAKQFTKDRQQRIRVETFTPETAKWFLLSQIDKEADASEQELAISAKISKSVDNHPLALDIIGCHIRQCGKSLENFIQEYPSFYRDFIFRADIKAWYQNPYQRFIDDAVGMSLESAICGQSLSGSSRLLLQMLAIFDSDGVSSRLFVGNSREKMLCDGPDELECFPHLEDILENPFECAFEDSSSFDKALENLMELALVTVDKSVSNLQCNRLVRIAVERSMDPFDLELTFSRVIFFLNASFPMQSDGRPLHAEWKRCEELASSVVCALDAYELRRDKLIPPILLCEVVCRCSWYYFEKGQFSTAMDLADRAIRICETALKHQNHPGYSEWFVKDMISHQVNTKAAIARELPLYDHGHRLSRDVITIREENRRDGCEEDEMWIIAATGNLAVSMMGAGDYEDASQILLALLNRDDTGANKDIYLSNLCLCLANLGRLDDALAYGKQTTEAVRQLRGEKSAQMAVIKFYISKIHRLQDNIQMAICALEECLDIRRQKMPKHHSTGFTLHQMGCLKAMDGKPKEAIELFKDAYGLLASSECHPGALCRTMLAISAAFLQCDEIEKSERYFAVAEKFRMEIKCTDTSNWGRNLAMYDRFVTVGLR